MRPFFPDNDKDSLEEDAEIELQAAVENVIEIQQNHVFEAHLAATEHLPKAGHPRPHLCAFFMPVLVNRVFIGQAGPGPHEAHFALKHVDQLWQFVQAGFAQKTADLGNAGIVGDFNVLPDPSWVISPLIIRVTKSLWRSLLAPVIIERNLYILKNRPPLPTALAR